MKKHIIIQSIVWAVAYLLAAYILADINWLANRSQEDDFRSAAVITFLMCSVFISYVIFLWDT